MGRQQSDSAFFRGFTESVLVTLAAINCQKYTFVVDKTLLEVYRLVLFNWECCEPGSIPGF
jgi:hypothetical protein